MNKMWDDAGINDIAALARQMAGFKPEDPSLRGKTVRIYIA
jgi:hypothetical protein